ncbi:GerMN domain-containing protein [Glutamicibacter sp. NPDC087344]|uniref:GerMN domain-containing protein n=1 Tax=Glutamicibacter sp. NPDC087344 TaxID=3363994 RepID=UPI00381AB27C
MSARNDVLVSGTEKIPAKQIDWSNVQQWYKRRIPRRVAATGAVAVLAFAAGCGFAARDDSFEMPANSTVASQGMPVATDSLEQAFPGQKMPVYWLENTGAGVYLYREYATDSRHQEPIGDAVAYLLSGKPADPDWYTHLKSTDDVGVSIDNQNLITLDLPAKVFSASLDQGLSERSIQQLVFTATAAASNAGILVGQTPATVRILVDGTANATVFGSYQLHDVYERDAEFMAPIWIIDPQFGSTTKAGAVKINGRTSGFDEGTFYSLESTTSDGEHTPITSASRISAQSVESDGSFTLTTRLPAGSYTLSVWGQENGSDARVAEVSSEFTVG